jgi:hypothetical protein
MLWLKLIGWIMVLIPVLGFMGFSAWMIRSAMDDDENIVAFVGLMGVIFLVGIGILAVTYFTDLAATLG